MANHKRLAAKPQLAAPNPSLFGFLLLITFATLFLALPAKANCIDFAGQNERLSNYCLLEAVTGRRLDKQTALAITERLQQEGYFGGLNTPRITTSAYPSLFYSSNINGGNPDRKLVIGELEFEGNPTLVAEEGMILGANVGGSIRNTYGEGRYFNGSFAAALNWSPEHGTSYTTGSIAGCFKNKIKRSGYVDFCLEGSEQKKDLSDSRSRSISLDLGQLGFTKQAGFTDARFGLSRSFYARYQQSQVKLQIQAIHPGHVFSSVKLRVGEPVQNQMALKYGVDFRLSKSIRGRQVTVGLTHEYSDGGKLLGVNRSDTVNRISATMPLNRAMSINAGYQETRSSISYFSTREPSIFLTLNW